MAWTSDATKPVPTSKNTAVGGGRATISAVHPDIIQTHILTRLDGPALASAACTSSQFHALASDENLWADICHSTWPSTNTPRIRHVISNFAHRSRSFFSDSFSLIAAAQSSSVNLDRIPELISAVDVHYRQQIIFSKVVETETVTGWFRCSPFRIDLLDPKDVVQTPINYPEGEETAFWKLGDDLTLSWILIDPNGRRAMNLSSLKPVSVQRHWLSGEVHVRFATVIAGGDRGSPLEFALCSLLLTFSGVEGGDMQAREVSLQIEDMDGMHLNGRDSLVILQRALEHDRERKLLKEEEGKKRYEEFVTRKKEREERKVRAEGRLDMLCVGLAAALTVAALFGLCVSWR